MSGNRSVSDAGPMEGFSPFEGMQRENGRFAPYPSHLAPKSGNRFPDQAKRHFEWAGPRNLIKYGP